VHFVYVCQVSYFHKELETKQQTKDSVLHDAFLSAYWLAREEIAYHMFKALLELEGLLGISEIHSFDHISWVA